MARKDAKHAMILIADAHVSPRNEAAFFRMLESLENGRDSLIFLGDIFDLWIALPRYETALHRAFLNWCRRQKPRRTVGFMEGNREFFVARRHADAFTWCSDAEWFQDSAGNVFTHGDRINSRDVGYLRFRRLVKNPVIRNLLLIFPFGPAICHGIKRISKKTNRAVRRILPEADINRFCHDRLQEGASTVFIGHFHRQSSRIHPDGRSIHLLPDWLTTGEVTVNDSAAGRLAFRHWRHAATRSVSGLPVLQEQNDQPRHASEYQHPSKY